MKTSWKLLAVFTTAAMIVGCSGNANKVKTVAVSGTVTYKGQPVEGAIVTFNPTDSKNGKTAIGKTDATGKYRLMTFQQDDGAVEGSYKVTVSKIDASKLNTKEDVGASEEDPGAAYAAAEAAGEDVMGSGEGGQKGASSKTKDLLPTRYKDPEASGLIANVSADGPNTFDFVLED